MRLNILILICSVSCLEGGLIKQSFYGSTQRIGEDTTFSYCEHKVFNDVYGISMVKPRGTNTTLLIVSDPNWCRLIYTNIEEGSRNFRYLRQFGNYGSNDGQFITPKGICIDTTIYNSNTQEYSIYIADSKNNRITNAKYKITKDSIVINGNLITDLSNPTNISCVSQLSGGSYIVIVEKDLHRIKLYQRNASGSISLIQNYGSQGSSDEHFFQPQGVAICAATDSIGGYYIYITDTGNRRVVCLRYKPNEGIFWLNAYKTLENAKFLSVAASQYYCVYVTDYNQNKIWVFTPELHELLYTYGNINLINGPKDICIDWDRIGLTEKWSATTGIQYFRIEPEVRDIYPLIDTFDALKDSTKFNYKVCETSGYLTMIIENDTIFSNQFHSPGTDTSPYWYGRDGNGKVVLPENHNVYFRSPNNLGGTGTIDVKGTKIETQITNLHWTSTGNPYVFNGTNCYVDIGDTLTIDTGVVVMGHDEYSNINIDGSIRAIGNENDTILFTGHRKLLPVEDSTYPGMWLGVRIAGHDPANKFSYCRFEYANVPINLCADTVQKNNIDHCQMKNDSFAGECNFWSAGGFCSNNEYINNSINKIRVLPTIYEWTGRILDTLHIQKQTIPYYFPPPGRAGYNIYGDTGFAAVMKVDPGVKMEFSPGISIKFGDIYGLFCRGKLISEGSENDSIYYVRAGDTLSWWGFQFDPLANPVDSSKILYSVFENAGDEYGYSPTIKAPDSAFLDVNHSRFSKCLNYAVDLPKFNPYNNITISNCLFTNDSVPIRTSFSNINGIISCALNNNKHDWIEIVGCDSIHKDMTIHKLAVPYCLRYHFDYGSNFGIYGQADSLTTLTIEPGTKILCDSGTVLVIGGLGDSLAHQRGKIICQGNDSDYIEINTLNESNPWQGILLSSYDQQDTSIFNKCIISGANIGLSLNNSSPTITHSNILTCDNGIQIKGPNSRPLIENDVISLNNCGLFNTDSGSTNLKLINNNFVGNKTAFRNDWLDNYIHADSNWFGDASGPWDPSFDAPDTNIVGRGDSIGDYVVYRPWLTTPYNSAIITLLTPNTPDSLYGESNYEIKWSRTVTPSRQELYYTSDFPTGGITESPLWYFIDSVAPSESTYIWKVKSVVSNRCRVAVKIYYTSSKKEKNRSQNYPVLLNVGNNPTLDNPGLMAIDISDTNFTILDTVAPQISVIRPNASNDYFFPGVDDTIRWQASDNYKLSYFNIYLSTDGGSNFNDVIAQSLSAPCSVYAWSPPDYNCYNCVIKVEAYDSCDNYNNDQGDEPFAIPIRSFCFDMTAFNNGRRLVRSSGDNFHFVFSDDQGCKNDYTNEQYYVSFDNQRRVKSRSFTQAAYYTSSSDIGMTWSSPMYLGYGHFPVLTTNDIAKPICLAWTDKTDSRIYYKYKGKIWISTTTLIDSVENVTYTPVSIQLAGDTVHLATLRRTLISSNEQLDEVMHYKYAYSNPSSVISESLDHWRLIDATDSLPRFVSLAIDGNNAPYLTWERPPDDTIFEAPLPNFDIYYAWTDTLGWHSENMSETEYNSINPSIECYGGHTYVVWEEEGSGGYDVFLFKRNYNESPPSDYTEEISNTGGINHYPVTRMGGVILWTQDDSSDVHGKRWDPFFMGWNNIGNLSNTADSSCYPQVEAWQGEQGLAILSNWSEGNGGYYGMGRNYKTNFPMFAGAQVSLPSYYLKLGAFKSTPYTKFRDAVEAYGSDSFDCGNDSLVYNLPYIGRKHKCRLVLELYRPEEDLIASAESWKIKTTVNGVMPTTIELKAGELKTLDVYLPGEVNTIGHARILLKKVNSGPSRILARRLMFFEYERNADPIITAEYGGAQGDESAMINPMFFESLHPNPARNDLTLRLNSRDTRMARIRLYDISGRLVSLNNTLLSRGINEITIKTTDLSAGVYFINIETDLNKVTRKFILLK